MPFSRQRIRTIVRVFLYRFFTIKSISIFQSLHQRGSSIEWTPHLPSSQPPSTLDTGVYRAHLFDDLENDYSNDTVDICT